MTDQYHLKAYDYDLPDNLIAQHPATRRDQSRLLLLHTANNAIEHRQFSDIKEYFRPGDLLVVNNTRVFPARLLGHKETGGKVEMLLLHYPEKIIPEEEKTGWKEARALTLIKSSKRPKEGSRLFFGEGLEARVDHLQTDGKVAMIIRYRTSDASDLDSLLDRFGQMPLPPYISRPQGNSSEDRQRYQTRYACHTGSVAAPTAGLHFSDELLQDLDNRGIARTSVTLHVGYGTFAPVRSENIREHVIHQEYVEVTEKTAATINATRAAGGRIWAVGTTTVRTLEYAVNKEGLVQPTQGSCGLYIYPGYRFRVVDNLITNFHLPRSSLLFLVSALAGRENILRCYREAVIRKYRFFSYGDAMAIIRRP